MIHFFLFLDFKSHSQDYNSFYGAVVKEGKYPLVIWISWEKIKKMDDTIIDLLFAEAVDVDFVFVVQYERGEFKSRSD